MDFGEVLGRAWRITWKHKILWIFGIMAGCQRGGGGGGGGGNGGRITNPGGAPSGENPLPPGVEQWGSQFAYWIQNHVWVVVLFVIFIIVLVVLAIWLGTMGRIALIKGAAKADAGAERLGFMELWSESSPFFWRVFLLSLVVGLAFLAVLLPFLLGGVALTAVTMGLGALCLIPLICLLIPVSIVVGLVIQLGEVGLVLEDLRIMDGIRRGWEVFKSKIGPVLLLWLILLVIAFAISVAIAIPVLIVVVPAAIAFAASSNGGAAPAWTPLIVAGACLVAYLPVLLLLNGILTAYLQSVWTLGYIRLTRPKEVLEAPASPAPNAA